MTEKKLLQLLHTLFEVPLNTKPATDLSTYIQDSIDVGELVAEIKAQTTIELKLADFKTITTLAELHQLISEKVSS